MSGSNKFCLNGGYELLLLHPFVYGLLLYCAVFVFEKSNNISLHSCAKTCHLGYQ